MGKYAERTKVPVQQSRAEIEKTLTRYGADGFMYGHGDGNAMIAFRMNDRHVKFVLPIPDDKQQERQRWRALLLVIKAKLEAVECGVSVFEDEFMAHIMLPDGQTVGQFMRPQIEDAYEKGDMPALLSYAGKA